MSGKVTKSVTVRLQEKIIVSTAGCWEYQGYLRGKNKQHAGFFFNGKDSYAHIAAYETWVGPVGNNCVLHHCDNGICINPEHLFLGDRPANIADMVKKGRQAKGENHSQAKLTQKLVEEIRHTYYNSIITQRALAVQYDIDPSQVSRIVRYKIWGG